MNYDTVQLSMSLMTIIIYMTWSVGVRIFVLYYYYYYSTRLCASCRTPLLYRPYSVRLEAMDEINDPLALGCF